MPRSERRPSPHRTRAKPALHKPAQRKAYTYPTESESFTHAALSSRSCFDTESSFERLLSETIWPAGVMPDPGDRKKSKQRRATKSPSSSSPDDSSPEARPPRGRRTAASSTHRCEICNQYYSRRDNLRVHQRVHSGEMPYECRYCAQRFRWMGALRSHEANHVRDGHQLPAHRDSDRPDSTRASSSRSRPAASAAAARSPSSRGSSSRASSSRHSTSARGQGSSSRTASSREHRNTSSATRNRPQLPPLELSASSILLTEEDPVVSPMLQEPWHDVLDDNHH